MVMRYHLGLGVGHTYAHRNIRSSQADENAGEKDNIIEDEEMFVDQGEAVYSDSGDSHEKLASDSSSDVDSEFLDIYD
jgi:hypothetical protein